MGTKPGLCSEFADRVSFGGNKAKFRHYLREQVSAILKDTAHFEIRGEKLFPAIVIRNASITDDLVEQANQYLLTQNSGFARVQVSEGANTETGKVYSVIKVSGIRPQNAEKVLSVLKDLILPNLQPKEHLESEQGSYQIGARDSAIQQLAASGSAHTQQMG